MALVFYAYLSLRVKKVFKSKYIESIYQLIVQVSERWKILPGLCVQGFSVNMTTGIDLIYITFELQLQLYTHMYTKL